MQTFEEEWEEIRLVFEAAEAKYRSERLRPNPDWPLRGNNALNLKRAVEDVCRSYMGATDSQRSEMREFVAGAYTISPLLLNAVSEFGKRLSESGESVWLEMALAAASLENLKLDYCDTYVALGSLYLTTLSVGLEPSPAFQRAAKLSSGEEGNGGGSARGFFARFEKSAYSAESVSRRAESLRSKSEENPGFTE